jgi:aminopeptidase N
VLDHVRALMDHEAFDKTNPNKVRALVGGFVGGNPTQFHKKDGSGYKFLADVVIEMNDINAKTATGLSKLFTQFKRYDSDRQALMVEQMERIMAVPTLDVGIKEILGKALDTAAKKPTNDNAKKFGQSARKQG